jgi:hypothetical protein
MSLGQAEIDEELRSWEGFARALRGEDRVLFERMMAGAREAMPAMQASDSAFPVEALFMGILFSQHKLIEELKRENAELRGAKA